MIGRIRGSSARRRAADMALDLVNEWHERLGARIVQPPESLREDAVVSVLIPSALIINCDGEHETYSVIGTMVMDTGDLRDLLEELSGRD